jgi:thiamine biosynthesis lipoprotein ApbE
MKRAILGVVATMVLSACGGDICAKSEECAKKSGETFSITECRRDDQINREKAATKNCSNQYGEFTACLSTLQCGSTLDQLNANCGAKATALDKCIN